MKSIRPMIFAAWLLDHFASGLNNEALTGDLLEELRGGRSVAWYWRQVCFAIAVGAWSRLRELALPLIFSAGWTSLYPGWRLLCRTTFAAEMKFDWSVPAWPWSAILPIVYGMIPALTFVWFGFLAYVLLRPRILRDVSALSLFGGLSTSLNIVLISTILLLRYFRQSRIDLRSLLREDFYSAFHLLSISIPLALSLLAALLFTIARSSRQMRNRRDARLLAAGGAANIVRLFCFILVLCGASRALAQSASVQFVSVDKDVKLAVLDWGGHGRPLIFLAGLGNDAHVYDTFAPNFTDHYHVYGITRRGFGDSSRPTPDNGNYSADRLGDDVLAVMAALKLERPVIVGHSLAGEELSSIGSRYPNKVAGLIYLDAAYGYAYYDRQHGDTIFDFFQLTKELDDFVSGRVRDSDHAMRDLSADVSDFNRDLEEAMKRDSSVPELHPRPSAIPPIVLAINLGGQKYTSIPVPVLAIFACPHNFEFDPALRSNPTLKAQVEAEDTFITSRQADAFLAGVPSAHVVRLANADHYVFRSNPAEVVREMTAFLSGLR
jgi:non-heme chloroperoxidase